MLSGLGRKLQRLLQRSLVLLLISFGLVGFLGCGRAPSPGSSATGVNQAPAISGDTSVPGQARPLSPELAEVSPPVAIQELKLVLDKYQPHVKILSPQPDQVLNDDVATVRLQVDDLPLFRNAKLGMGPYLHVILDNRQDEAIYNTDQPLTFADLAPGTHTLRVFAARPWHESFKNDGAYDQVTFHVFTKTNENNPAADQPLLTFNQPQGSYGAEPILLDYYLTNAPLHLAAQADPSSSLKDWQIRATVNGSSFTLNQWQAIYLQGFKPGKNWVQLELLDQQGRPIENVFNSTTRLVTLEPNSKDTLARLVRGDLKATDVLGIADPNATVKVPQEPVRSQEPAVTPQPPVKPPASPSPEPKITPTPPVLPKAPPQPPETPSVEVVVPRPETTAAPVIPQPQVTVTPEPEVAPTITNTPEPVPTAKPRRLRNYFQRQTSPSPAVTAEPEVVEPVVSPSPVIETAPPAQPGEPVTEPSTVTSFQKRPEPTAGSTPQVEPTEEPQQVNQPSPIPTVEAEPDSAAEMKETLRDLKQVFIPQSGVPEEVPLIQVSPSPTLPSRYRSKTITPTPQVVPEAQPEQEVGVTND